MQYTSVSRKHFYKEQIAPFLYLVASLSAISPPKFDENGLKSLWRLWGKAEEATGEEIRVVEGHGGNIRNHTWTFQNCMWCTSHRLCRNDQNYWLFETIKHILPKVVWAICHIHSFNSLNVLLFHSGKYSRWLTKWKEQKKTDKKLKLQIKINN